jgi:outer membrane lipoprotein-sorting protein
MENDDVEMERRLRGLSAALREEGGFSERVMARIRVDAGSPHGEKGYRFWRLVMKGSLGIAASVVVGVAAWNLCVGTPRMAYGMEGVPERMMELKSLHLKGVAYGANGEAGPPLEVFVQQPGRMRVNGMPMRTMQDGKHETVSSLDMILTPTGMMVIDAAKKHVDVSPETEIEAQLQTEQMLQQQVKMLLGTGGDFKEIRKEKIGDVETEVCESKVNLGGEPSRVLVFMNPTTRLPMRSEMYSSRGGTKEHLEMVFTTIEPDAVIPQGTFDYTIPADYEVVKSDGAMGMMGRVDSFVFGVRLAIALDQKTFLVCWRMYDSKDPGADLEIFDNPSNKLVIRGNEKVVYHERLLRADEAPEGFHWRWSLVSTEKPASAWGNAISMAMRTKGGECGDSFMPVALPARELAEVVEKVQMLTLPVGGKAMTLQEMEAVK